MLHVSKIDTKGFYFYKNILYVGNTMVAKQRRATSKPAALSGLKIKRYDVLSHNENKAGEIDTGHMSRRYLDDGEYRTASQLNMIAK